MADRSDPYRTLGLPRTASLDEVKRAYRRLAKAHHPDAAGEADLPRFLAIQAAYDRIVGPGASGAGATGRGATRRPWDADPARADATRRAYGRRARRPAGSATRQGASRPQTDEAGRAGETSRAGEAGRSGEAGATGEAGWSGDRDSTADGGQPDGGTRAGRRPRATLGSTSYDGADTEPFEPDWGGASWYGTTSGTYWTLNPKEYADPRKHGPEYQARGRKAREASGAAGGLSFDPEADERATPESGPTGPPPPSGRTSASPTHTTASWWEATSGDPTTRGDPTPRAARPRPSAARPGSNGTSGSNGPSGPRDPAPDVDPATPFDLAGRWLDDGRGGVAGRVGRAVIGWAPIALGIGWVAGEITGCGRFSATCDAAAAPLAWFAQLVILASLLLVPGLARIAGVATVATLAAAIPGSLLLSAMGASADTAAAGVVLGGLLVIAWLAGLVFGLARELRGAPSATPSDGDGPVS
jgi:hypothetical protein